MRNNLLKIFKNKYREDIKSILIQKIDTGDYEIVTKLNTIDKLYISMSDISNNSNLENFIEYKNLKKFKEYLKELIENSKEVRKAQGKNTDINSIKIEFKNGNADSIEYEACTYINYIKIAKAEERLLV